jgi:hypothetical protein
VQPSAHAAFVRDGKWHHFGEHADVAAPSNQDGGNPSPGLKSPPQ